MSGETIVVFGTQKTLASSGGAIASGSLAIAGAANYDIVADGASFPDGDFVLTGAFATAPVENGVCALYARPLAVDGAANAEAPETTRPTVFIGSFVVNDVTTTQSIVLTGRDLLKKADYYIHNSGTGQSLGAGWTLKVTPRSYKAAP